MAQYGTTEVAQICAISLNTVRQWANDYSSFLSPNARGEHGDRTFNTHDLEVLKYVAQLRSERMRKDAILVRLGETSFPEIEPADQPSAITLPDVPDTPRATPAPIVAQDYLMSVERRFEALERSVSETKQAQRPGWWLWVFGVLCGLGLAAIAELFALIASRGH